MHTHDVSEQQDAALLRSQAELLKQREEKEKRKKEEEEQKPKCGKCGAKGHISAICKRPRPG